MDEALVEVLLRIKEEGSAQLREAQGQFGELKERSSLAQVAMGGLTTAALAATAAVAAAGAAAAVFAVQGIDHIQDAGHEAFEMGRKFGISAEEATSWIGAAAQVGISADQLSTGFKFLGKNIGEGSKPAAEALAELGVQVKDAQGNFRPLSDVMADVSAQFAALPDGADKVGLAVRLFGRSGADLIPILDEGSAGLKDLMENAKAAGVVLSHDQVDAAEKAYQAHKRFDLALQGVENQIGLALMPTLAQLANWMTSTGIPAAKAFFEERLIPAAKAAVEFVETNWPRVQAAIDASLKWLTGTALPMVQGFTASHRAQFQQIADDVNRIMDDVQSIIATSLPRIEAFWRIHGATITAVVVGALTLILNVITGTLNVITAAMDVWADLSAGNWAKLWGDFVNVIKSELAIVVSVLDGLTGMLLSVLQDVAIGAGRGAAALGAAIVHGIVNGISGSAGAVASAVAGIQLPGGLTVGSVLGAAAGAAATVAGDVLGFAEGGVVPGPAGAPRLAVVHGGEMVLNPGQQAAIGATSISITVNAQTNASPQDIADAVNRNLMRSLRRNSAFVA